MPTIALCAIVRNESKNMARFLASVKPYVDEMIVVDTGSDDNTVDIAQQFGAKVNYFKWCDDFAAARNYSLSLATTDWILSLDADEELLCESKQILEQLTASSEILAYTMERQEVFNPDNLTPPIKATLFQNNPELRYVNRFHEMLKFNGQDIPLGETQHIQQGIQIFHYGYQEATQEQKIRYRNIPILERIRQEGELSLGLLYCLAGMYNHTAQEEKAVECYQEAFERLLPHLMQGDPPREAFIPSLLYVLGVRSLMQEDYETTSLLCQQGLKWFSNYPPLNYLTGVTLRNMGFLLGATPYFEYCLHLGQTKTYYNYNGDAFEHTYMTTSPAYDLGCTYIELGDREQARIAFQLALSFDPNFTPALDKLNQI